MSGTFNATAIRSKTSMLELTALRSILARLDESTSESFANSSMVLPCFTRKRLMFQPTTARARMR
ncbi:MAG TPA: hypothetical protein VNT30_05240 [Stellaceae bacterium]|nr:hypothetical protein [Stellaceae bacterium]